MNNRITASILILVSLAITACAPSRSDITGTWASPSPEDIGNGLFVTREFTMSSSTWDLTFKMFADQQQTMPIFTLNVEGPYSLNEHSSVQSAYEGVFGFSRRTLTLHTSDPDTIAAFGFQDCDLELNKPGDISLQTCSFFPSITQCPQEYDIVKVSGGRLQFGSRPADNNMCTPDKRPTALGYSLERV